jgi:hypothetical protein
MYKKLIVGILTLFLVLIGLEKAYDYFLRNNVNLKSSYVASHRIGADALFLGPCEPLWMMDPALFKTYTGFNAYNLSTVHANFAENEVMLRLYLEQNPSPKFLFLYVTTESVDGSFNLFNTYAFPQLLHKNWVRERVQEEDPDYSRWTVIPFMKYAYYGNFISFSVIQGMKHVFSDRTTPYFKDGFVPPHGIVWDGRMEDFKSRYPAGKLFNWNTKEIESLKRIVDEAKQHGIQLIFYESPMLNEIKPFVLNRADIKQKITKFAGENGIPYWVFDTMKISDSRSCFFSILNTNEKGSAEFNKTFAGYFMDKALPYTMKQK